MHVSASSYLPSFRAAVLSSGMQLRVHGKVPIAMTAGRKWSAEDLRMMVLGEEFRFRCVPHGRHRSTAGRLGCADALRRKVCVCSSQRAFVSARRHPAHPASVFIVHPGEKQVLWSHITTTQGCYIVDITTSYHHTGYDKVEVYLWSHAEGCIQLVDVSYEGCIDLDPSSTRKHG